jgi:hypothetical protein
MSISKSKVSAASGDEKLVKLRGGKILHLKSGEILVKTE